MEIAADITRTQTVPKKEHEELLAKLRILEARRAEDRERLRDVDRLKEEGEEWIRVREKSKGAFLCVPFRCELSLTSPLGMVAKMAEMAAELKILRKQVRPPGILERLLPEIIANSESGTVEQGPFAFFRRLSIQIRRTHPGNGKQRS